MMHGYGFVPLAWNSIVYRHIWVVIPHYSMDMWDSSSLEFNIFMNTFLDDP